jgi:putative flippase GtrA
LVGALNTLLGYGAYCLSLYGGLSVSVASLVAIVVGVLVSFTTQGFVVFGHVTVRAFFRFMVNWALMYGVYVGVVSGLQKVGVSPYFGGLVAFVPTTTVSYFILRDYVFRGSSTAIEGRIR